MAPALIPAISKHAIKAAFAGKYIMSKFLICVYNNIEINLICRRCRKIQPGNSKFALVPGSLNTYSDSITAELRHKDNQHVFVFKLEALVVNCLN